MYMQYAAGLPPSPLPRSASSAEIIKAKVTGCVSWLQSKMTGSGLTP